MNEEIEMTLIKLDDGNEYFILDKINDDNNEFVYLADSNNPENILLRKRNIINNEVILEELSNLEEIKKCFNLFFKKHPELLEESL